MEKNITDILAQMQKAGEAKNKAPSRITACVMQN